MNKDKRNEDKITDINILVQDVLALGDKIHDLGFGERASIYFSENGYVNIDINIDGVNANICRTNDGVKFELTEKRVL